MNMYLGWWKRHWEEQLEGEEMSHFDSVVLMNWMNHLRTQWRDLFNSKKKEELCTYSWEGIKRHRITLFRWHWLNCLNCLANSLIDYAYSMPTAYYYNNDYTYDYTDVTGSITGYQYKSLLPMTDNIQTVLDMVLDNNRIRMSREEDPIRIIREALNRDLIVHLAVDLYHCVYSVVHY